MSGSIETSLNVTDYPEPKEQKCYVFECDCSCKGIITIYADNEEEARERLDSGDFNDNELYDFEIEDVKGVSNDF